MCSSGSGQRGAHFGATLRHVRQVLACTELLPVTSACTSTAPARTPLARLAGGSHLVKVACTIHLPMHPRVYRSVQVPEGSVSLNVPCLATIFTRNTLRLPANSACSPWLRPVPGFSPKHTDSESLASPVQSIRTTGCRPRCSARAEGLVRFCSPPDGHRFVA